MVKITPSFHLNRKFRREYAKLFKRDPLTANAFLLLCELADKNGEVVFEDPVTDLQELLVARFGEGMRNRQL